MNRPGMFRDVTFRLFMAARVVWAPTAMGVAGAVYDEQGRILLVKHRYNPGWRLPGGGRDWAGELSPYW